MDHLIRNFIFGIGLIVIAKGSIQAGPPKGAPTDLDPKAYQGLSSQDLERLRKGELVFINDFSSEQSTSKGMVQAAIIFNQPIDTVWTLMAQGWRQEEYLPNVDRTILAKKLPDGDIIENRLKILFVKINFWVRGYHYPDRYYVRWTLAPGYKNDMKRLEGFWQYYYVDDTHTLARYGTITETGFGVPTRIQEYLTKRDLPTSLGRLKFWVDSGGTYRKPGYQPPK